MNNISHTTASELIKYVKSQGIKLKNVYVDTVGPPKKYQQYLEKQFPEMDITVSKKADDIYPTVSAASIVAKVLRDHIISSWEFEEKIDPPPTLDFGEFFFFFVSYI